MSKKIPLIHITDLYHPPQDPDDHFDLATLFALPEIEIKTVLLDMTKQFVDGKAREDYPRDPGFIPVNQLSYLTGKSFPVAVGPSELLKSIDDDVSDRPFREQAAVNLLLQLLSDSDEKIIITCVACARIIAAAYNRNSELMKSKIKSVNINAGSSDDSITDEWNVNLDLNAWKCLLNSELDINIFPCTGGKGPFHISENNTFWGTTHKQLIEDLPQELRAWFHYALTGNQRGDFIRILSELGNGGTFHNVLFGERNMWSTASLVMSAGRGLVKTSEGWRFVNYENINSGEETVKWFLEPIKCNPGDHGQLNWKKDSSGLSNIKIFRREIGKGHAKKMSEAFSALLKEIKL